MVGYFHPPPYSTVNKEASIAKLSIYDDQWRLGNPRKRNEKTVTRFSPPRSWMILLPERTDRERPGWPPRPSTIIPMWVCSNSILARETSILLRSFTPFFRSSIDLLPLKIVSSQWILMREDTYIGSVKRLRLCDIDKQISATKSAWERAQFLKIVLLSLVSSISHAQFISPTKGLKKPPSTSF